MEGERADEDGRQALVHRFGQGLLCPYRERSQLVPARRGRNPHPLAVGERRPAGRADQCRLSRRIGVEECRGAVVNDGSTHRHRPAWTPSPDAARSIAVVSGAMEAPYSENAVDGPSEWRAPS